MNLFRRHIREFLEVEGWIGRAAPGEILEEVSRCVSLLCESLRECESRGVPHEELRAELADLRAVHAASPFIRRLQTWPRGYSGDFETIEYMMGGENRAEPNTLTYYCEAYALKCPIARQHSAKLRRQAGLIREVLTAPDAATRRVLSLAPGNVAGLRSIQNALVSGGGTLVLADADADALAFARERLAAIEDRCVFLRANVIRALKALRDEPPFDLIVTGGLCDYLTDRQMVHVLARAYGNLLKPGGRLFLTQVADGNSFRPWMEYLAEWRLTERGEEELRALLAEAGCDGAGLSLEREETGLTCLLTLEKPGLSGDAEAIRSERLSPVQVSS